MTDGPMRRPAYASDDSRAAELIRRARAAAARSYSPYSRFPVGAAVLASDGRVYVGTNVENASYGLTICAERVAIFTAVAAGARGIEALAVAVMNDVDTEAERMPCGACRQVMAELMAPAAAVFIDGVGDRTLEALLPAAFVVRRQSP